MKDISADQIQGYLDGFKAALDTVASTTMRISEHDPAMDTLNKGIDLGIRHAELVLRHQYDTFLKGDKP